MGGSVLFLFSEVTMTLRGMNGDQAPYSGTPRACHRRCETYAHIQKAGHWCPITSVRIQKSWRRHRDMRVETQQACHRRYASCARIQKTKHRRRTMCIESKKTCHSPCAACVRLSVGRMTSGVKRVLLRPGAETVKLASLLEEAILQFIHLFACTYGYLKNKSIKNNIWPIPSSIKAN